MRLLERRVDPPAVVAPHEMSRLVQDRDDPSMRGAGVVVVATRRKRQWRPTGVPRDEIARVKELLKIERVFAGHRRRIWSDAPQDGPVRADLFERRDELQPGD